MSNKQATGKLRGLRWSPQPIAHYTVKHPGSGAALMGLRQTFKQRPDIWNLFWITAAGWEEMPLSDEQVARLYAAAECTAGEKFLGRRVGDLVLTLTPTAFVDLIEANPKDAERLAIGKLLKHHLAWVCRTRADLFYQARISDFGMSVPLPEPMDETVETESTNILRLYRLGGSRASG